MATDGEQLTAAVRAVRQEWLDPMGRSVPAAESAVELATRSIPRGESGADRRTALRERLATIAADVDAEWIDPTRATRAADETAAVFVVAAGTVAVTALAAAFRRTFDGLPERVVDGVDRAVETAADGAAADALTAAVAAAETLAERADLARQGERTLAALDELSVPPAGDTTRLASALESAVVTGDAERLVAVADRVEHAPNASWHPESLLVCDPIEFERLVARLWDAAGGTRAVANTQRSNDGGADVLVSYTDGTTAAIEVKQRDPDATVGRPVVQQLRGAVSQFGTDCGFVATSGGFTRPAREAAETMETVSLVDGDRLLSLLETAPLVPYHALEAPD